jgi:hypothetical protein
MSTDHTRKVLMAFYGEDGEMNTADEIAEVPIEKLRDAVNDVSIQLEELRERMAAVINEMASDIAEIAGTRPFQDYQGVDIVGAIEALLDEAVLMPGTKRHTLHPTVPNTPGARKALLALYDAVGRDKPD